MKVNASKIEIMVFTKRRDRMMDVLLFYGPRLYTNFTVLEKTKVEWNSPGPIVSLSGPKNMRHVFFVLLVLVGKIENKVLSFFGCYFVNSQQKMPKCGLFERSTKDLQLLEQQFSNFGKAVEISFPLRE